MVILDARQHPAERLRISDDDVDRLKHSKSFVRVGGGVFAAGRAGAGLGFVRQPRRVGAWRVPTRAGVRLCAGPCKLRCALGLRNTSLQEPTGLSPQNTSTAIEVARITAAAALPEIARITSSKRATVA